MTSLSNANQADIIEAFNSTSIYDKRDDFDFDILFLFWMAMFHVTPLMECIFLDLYDLQECVVRL